MKTVAILGVGLMGSSLGLALKKRNVPVRIHAFARREKTRNKALERGAADAVFSDPAEAVHEADCVVFCVPVLSIPDLAQACRSGLRSGTVLTDVGSTKVFINKRVPDILAGSGVFFAGSHPVCGSEKQGIEAGDPDLYEGAVTVVTPTEPLPAEALRTISGLWESAGSVVRIMPAEEHDFILAATSHLPHVVAASAVLSAGNNGLLCGSGFRDTTRVASGSPDIWRDILLTNRGPVKGAVQECIQHLNDLLERLDSNDAGKLESWFAEAAARRSALLDRPRRGGGTF